MSLPPLFHTTASLGALQPSPNVPSVTFRLYFPASFPTHITSIRVIGDFQPHTTPTASAWDPSSAPALFASVPQAEGTFWTLALNARLPAGFYEYQYVVTFDDGSAPRIVADPCARYAGRGANRSGFVIGGSTAAENEVTPLAARKPLGDLVVYELHALDFTDEFRGGRAPLDALRDKLDYLVDLGVNALLIMPWTAWKDALFDWGYQPFQYFAISYAYANDVNRPEEKISWLKRLISACHERGIHVIMDGVYNHCDESFPYKSFYLRPDDCPYTAQPFGGTFPGLQDLDFNNQCTQDFIRDVCLYWISQFKIDGIRFDNTVNFYVPGNPRGLPELLQSIEDYVTADGQQNFSMTLEHLDLDAANLVSTTAATSYWDNAIYGQAASALWSGTISPLYLAALNNTQYVSPGKTATLYLSNHDHSTIAWAAGAPTLSGGGAWFRTQPHVIALLTASGTPLIPAGQEWAEDYWIPEDDAGSGRRVRARPLRWAGTTDAFGKPLGQLYRKMLKLRAEHPALRGPGFYPPKWEGWMQQFDAQGFGVDVQRGLVVYHRYGNGDDGALERFYILLNFGVAAQTVQMQFAEDGEWEDVLADSTVKVAGNRLTVTVESNWGHIFFKKTA
ncbi:glycoside hydrolase [Trichodelitschia bisporula]|uniref:Glycoside hydrolase n=1 Tax=Trichodelitschia bisporula TaxID=703511 RepID=A0A6G1HZT1_9PEZI|nr:glycoside hydrolase [Trichodelitschia bisporula]